MADREAKLSRSARAWLDAEIRYIAQHNPRAARTLVQKFRAAGKLIGQYPNGGEAGAIPGTRRFVVASYILTVRQDAKGMVEIAAIRHSRQADAYKPTIDDNADDGGTGGGDVSGDPT